MTKEFKYLLQLVGACAQGIALNAKPDDDIDWVKLIAIAREQTVFPLLAYALKIYKTNCPEPLRDEATAALRELAIKDAMRRTVIMQLLDEMEAANIHVVVLKGYALADEYAVPQCRIAGDTDVYVKQEDEKSAIDFLKTKGFEITPRLKNDHHSVCKHALCGTIELHIRFFSHNMEKTIMLHNDQDYFLKEDFVRHIQNGKTYNTLGITDGLLYLVAHFFKHFVSSGANLRTIIDIGLYLKHHALHIDKEQMDKAVAGFGASKLYHTLLLGLVKYCKFDKSVFSELDYNGNYPITQLFDDIEQGGNWGKLDAGNRTIGYQMVIRKALYGDQGFFSRTAYFITKIIPKYVSMLFPDVQVLKEIYPYAGKGGLWPVKAWVHNFAHRIRQLLFSDRLARQVRPLVQGENMNLINAERDRIDLLKKLDLL